MPSRTELARNNIRAGVFVTISLILMLVVIIVLTDAIEALLRESRRYVVTFPIRQGVGYLSQGSEVRLGGMGLGRVLSVDLDPDEPSTTVRVEFEIDGRVQLYQNARVLVDSQLIGADSWLDIPFVGDIEAGPPPDDVIVGTTAPGLLTALLGSENAELADSIVRNADLTLENAATFSEVLARFPDDYDQRILPAMDNVKAASEDVRALTVDVREQRWPRWAATVDDVMAWAGGTTERIDEAIDEGRGMLASGRSMIEDNRPQVDGIVDNTDAASQDLAAFLERANAETLDRVHALLDRGQRALDDAGTTIATVRRDYDGWATRFDELMANASLASQELKFATIEVRRNPWKLLYRPTADELENELLYEAARSFAMAASDLKATGDTVERILRNHGDRLDGNREVLEQLSRDLQRSLENYTRAQDDLLDVLVD
ncbi:MAG: MlaD family protein [Planctomycetota bacterium]|jgi:ABC-type transporter Mla subunit MlaD